HEIYPAFSSVRNKEGDELVTAYAVHRPDGLWSLMLINKDPNRSYGVRVNFRNEATKKTSTFSGAVDVYQFSGAQYQLNEDASNPHPIKAEAPQHTFIKGSETNSFELPAYSLTVIRGPV